MIRVSTSDLWASALSNLSAAQVQQQTDTSQVSSGKLATDLGGFGASSSAILSLESTQTQITAYSTVNTEVKDRLAAQDQALGDMASAAGSAKTAILNAVANDSGTGLQTTIQGLYDQVQTSLNAQYGGQYLFSGGNSANPAYTNTSLTNLGAATVSSLFNNDQHAQTSTISQNTTVTTGFLASNVATGLITAFQTFENSGPFTGTLTAAQQSALEGIANSFDTENTNITSVQGQNGALQSEVDSNITYLTQQTTTLTSLISDKTDVDVATAYSNLQQSQQAVQASADVLASLKTDTLMNVLTP